MEGGNWNASSMHVDEAFDVWGLMFGWLGRVLGLCFGKKRGKIKQPAES